MPKPMLIRQSPMTGQWYAFTSYRVEGKALVVTGKKWDVTEQIEQIKRDPSPALPTHKETK